MPANTETLFALGAGPGGGRTSLDDYPPEALTLPKIGAFEVNTEAVVALDPDLVVGWTGNADALALKDRGFPSSCSRRNLKAVYANINAVGTPWGARRAAELVRRSKRR